MAFKVSPDAQLIFFSKVFGGNHATTKLAQSLIAAGVTFEVSMYTIRATFSSESDTVYLTKGTTSLMKHVVDSVTFESNTKLISEWVSTLTSKFKLLTTPVLSAEAVVKPLAEAFTKASKAMESFGNAFAGVGSKVIVTGVALAPGASILPAIKAVQTVTGNKSLYEAKQIVETIKAGGYVELNTYASTTLAEDAVKYLQATGLQAKVEETSVIPSVKPAPAVVPVPVPAVIGLKDAKAIGQRVHGTSAGSVYHTVAIGEHIRIAAKMFDTGSVSLRAEWTDNPQTDLKKLQSVGMQMKTGGSKPYASWHFDANGVPLKQCIGAFLYATGIEWRQMIKPSDVVVEPPPKY